MSEERDDGLRAALTEAFAADAEAQSSEPQPPPEEGESPPETTSLEPLEAPVAEPPPPAASEGEEPPPAAAQRGEEAPAKPTERQAPAEWQPPAEWSAQDRERYTKLPDDARRFVAELERRAAPQRERLTALERDYGGADKGFFTPQLRQRLQQMGRSVASTLNDWANAEVSLMTGNGVKERMAALILHAYDCDTAVVARELNMFRAQSAAARGQTAPPASGAGFDNGYAAPNYVAPNYVAPNGQVDPYDARIRALETVEEQRRRDAFDRDKQAATQTIEGFRDQRDDQGNLLRPHWTKLADKVIALADRDFRLNTRIDLDRLYHEAAWADPEVRQELIQQEYDRRANAAAEERKQKAEQARRAASSVNGAPGPGGPGPNGALGDPSRDLRSEIRAAMVPVRGGRI